MINFTDCKIDISSEYAGSDQKRGIIYDGKKYMLKMADRINSEKKMNLNSSYSNSIFSEKISCDILKGLGFEVQNTLLGYLERENKENQPVVACENFVPDGWNIISFKAIEAALLDDKPGKIPKLKGIYKIYTTDNSYFTKAQGKIELEKFWDQFILDAFLGNFDRHANNWSYLIKKDNSEIKRAPIYDCGSCLYPQIADNALEEIIKNKDEIDMRIYKFPNAALLDDDGKKINYFDYISSLKNKDCTNALKRVFPKIDLKVVNSIIDNQEGVLDIRKQFYKVILAERYDKILKISYEKSKYFF